MYYSCHYNIATLTLSFVNKLRKKIQIANVLILRFDETLIISQKTINKLVELIIIIFHYINRDLDGFDNNG